MHNIKALALAALASLALDVQEEDSDHKRERLSGAASRNKVSHDGPPVPRAFKKGEHRPKLKGRNRRVW
jgi:hypothetical protein